MTEVPAGWTIDNLRKLFTLVDMQKEHWSSLIPETKAEDLLIQELRRIHEAVDRLRIA